MMDITKLTEILFDKESAIKEAYNSTKETETNSDFEDLSLDGFEFVEQIFESMSKKIENLKYFPGNIADTEIILDLIDHYNFDLKEQKRPETEYLTIEDVINETDKYQKFLKYIKKDAFKEIINDSKFTLLIDEYNKNFGTNISINTFFEENNKEEKIKIIKEFKKQIIKTISNDSVKRKRIIEKYKSNPKISDKDKLKSDKEIIELLINDPETQKDMLNIFFEGTKIETIIKAIGIKDIEDVFSILADQKESDTLISINNHILGLVNEFQTTDPEFLNTLRRQIAIHAKDEIDGYVSQINIYENQLNGFVGGNKICPYDDFLKFISLDIIDYQEVERRIKQFLPNITFNNKEEVIKYLKQLKDEHLILKQKEIYNIINEAFYNKTEFQKLYENEIKKLKIIKDKTNQSEESNFFKLIQEMELNLEEIKNSDQESINITTYKKQLNKSKAYTEEYIDILQMPLICELDKLHRKSNLDKKLYHTMRVTILTSESLKNKNIPFLVKKLIILCALFHDIGRTYQGTFYDDYSEGNLVIAENKYGDGDELKELKHPMVGSFMLDKLIDFDQYKKLNKSKLLEYLPLINTVVEIHGLRNSDLSYLDQYCEEISFTSDAEVVPVHKILSKIFAISDKKKRTHNFAYDISEVFAEINPLVEDFYGAEDTRLNLIYIAESLLNSDPVLKNVVEQVATNYDNIDFISTIQLILQNNENYKIDDENIEDFKKIISLATLIVMDIDKIDILIQEATGWLDNDINKDKTTVKIPSEYFEIIGEEYTINLESYFGIELNEEVCEAIKKSNNNSKIENGVYSQPKSEIKKNASNYNLIEITLPSIKIKLDDNSSISNKIKANDSMWLNKKVSLPDDIIKYYLCLSDKTNLNINITRANNSLQIFWWRINEFIMRNMRLSSSLETIDNIKLLDQLHNYVNNNLDFATTQLIKPILFVAELYIEKIKQQIKEGKIKDGITEKKSKEIRDSIKKDLLTLYYNIDEITNEEDLINNMNTDRLFCIIINEYDKRHLNPNQNIGSGPKQ